VFEILKLTVVTLQHTENCTRVAPVQWHYVLSKSLSFKTFVPFFHDADSISVTYRRKRRRTDWLSCVERLQLVSSYIDDNAYVSFSSSNNCRYQQWLWTEWMYYWQLISERTQHQHQQPTACCWGVACLLLSAYVTSLVVKIALTLWVMWTWSIKDAAPFITFIWFFFVKLFKTSSMEIVSYCQTIFQFELPSTQISLRSQKFIVKYRLSDNFYCKYVV